MKQILFALLLCLSLLLLVPILADEQPPNVVLIFADDLGYGDLGCYGATKLKTPNIDKLAAEGRRFTDAHSASAVCTPSRYGLLTGEYPFRANGGKGLWGPAPVTSPLLIDTETQTIANLFKKSGYDTAVFGKWHLGFKEGKNDWQEPLRPGPQDLGFDHYFGMPVVNSAPPYVYVEDDRIVGSDPDDPLVHVGRSGKKVTPITPIPKEAAQRSGNQFGGAVEAHKRFNDFEVGTKLTEKATEWITSRGENPFFAYFSTTNVHHPFTPAKRFQGTSEAGWYGDFVHELDWIVGEVMKSLEASGVADNTLVLFTSDNGGMFNLGGREAARLGHKINGDLLGSKFGIWEGGHRVPFIAWWPGKIEAGSVSDQLLCSVDLMASFAALTGQDLEDPKDSINMLPALTGNPDKPLRTEMFMTPNKQSHMALRRGKWMFIPAKSDGGFRGSRPSDHAWGGAAVTTLVDSPNSDVEDGKIKDGAAPAQLYDLEADVNQTKNLYYDNLDLANEMAAAIKKARQDAGFRAGSTPRPPAAASVKDAGAPLSEYDDFKPVGNLHYSFESGTLDGWKITEGKLGEPVTTVPSLTRRKDAPFARHGSHHLSTLVPGNGEPLADTQVGVVQSPSFKLTGDKAAFLVSGGYNERDLYVALVDADSGDVLKKSGGSRDHRMRRVEWDVSKWKGDTVRFEVVDRATGGWGHLNVDDFSAQGEPAAGGAKKANPKPHAAAPVPAKTEAPRAAVEKPNFVVIFTDDQGYQDLGSYGSPDIATPNLDRMAAEGMRFTSFYAQTICGPSRTALMTASYPLRVAQVKNKCETHPIVHEKEITIAEILKTAGYRSAAFGKWDLATHSQTDWIPELLPRGQGFDYFFGTPSSNDRVVHLIRNEGLIEGNADMATLTRRYTDEAIEYIEENKGDPFFVYLAHTMPHTLLDASKEFKGKSRGGLYGDVIEEIDHNAGRILDKVKELGLDDNTYVIFTSDNGPWLLRKDHGGHALPLRSGKTTCWEGGMRVPCMVRAPGRVPAGTTCDLVTATIDLLPTFASIAGAEVPDDRVLDGKDISKVWHGEQDDLDRPFFYYQHFYLRGVRKGDWKVMLKHEEGPKSVTARWRNHVDAEDAKPLAAHQLYHLKDDIGETTDLAAKHPDKLAELLELAEWARADIGDYDRIGENARFFDDGPNRLEQGSGKPKTKSKAKGKNRKSPAKAGKSSQK